MSLIDKFDALAERYSELDYADATAYYRHRADVVVRLGPILRPGATLLDVACGDGGLGRPLLALGVDYHGIDGSPKMVEVARRALGDRVQLGSFDYVPDSPVDATTIFRSLYLAPDRRAFLEHVRSFTRVKLVFDFDPRAHDAAAVVRDVRAAGWTQIVIRPFLMPQRVRLPAPLQRLLYLVEPLPGARALTRIRFPLLVTAS